MKTSPFIIAANITFWVLSMTVTWSSDKDNFSDDIWPKSHDNTYRGMRNAGTIRSRTPNDLTQKFPYKKRYQKNKSKRDLNMNMRNSIDEFILSEINDYQITSSLDLEKEDCATIAISNQNSTLLLLIPQTLKSITAPIIEVRDFFLQVFDSQGYYHKKGNTICWRIYHYDALGAKLRGISIQYFNTRLIKSHMKELMDAQDSDIHTEGKTIIFYYSLPILSKIYTVGIIPTNEILP